MELPDIQNTYPAYRIPLDRVGIRNLKYPIKVLDRSRGFQHTVGVFNLYVDLPSDFKGTHMSRFIEVLNEFGEEIHIKNIEKLLKKLQEKLKARASHVEFSFPYFIEKRAPVSQMKSLMEYQVHIKASLIENKKDLIVGVKVPVMTVCPCSKSISKKGAHNQRGVVNLKIRSKRFIWIEQLIEIVEESASSPVYPLLKRVDEKFITENSYERPMFVEDVVRKIADKLFKMDSIFWFYIEVESFESIHPQNAYASLECYSSSSSISIKE